MKKVVSFNNASVTPTEMIEIKKAFFYLKTLQRMINGKKFWTPDIVDLSLKKDRVLEYRNFLKLDSALAQLNETVFNELAKLTPALPFKTFDLELSYVIRTIKQAHDGGEHMERMLSIARDKNGILYVALSAKHKDDIPNHDYALKSIEDTLLKSIHYNSDKIIIFCKKNPKFISYYREDKEANGRLCSEMSILDHVPVSDVTHMMTAWVGKKPKDRYSPESSFVPSSPTRYFESNIGDLALAKHCPGCARNMMALWIQERNDDVYHCALYDISKFL